MQNPRPREFPGEFLPSGSVRADDVRLSFRAKRAVHELADSLSRIEALVKDPHDDFRNGGVDTDPARDRRNRKTGASPFGDFGHPNEDVRQPATAADLLA